MKTRATKGSTKAAAVVPESANSAAPKVQLGPEDANLPKIFVLPEGLSSEARFVSLANPRYSTECPYVFCPETGLHEVTKIAATSASPRSWLLAPTDLLQSDGSEDGTAGKKPRVSKGFVTRAAELLLLTKIDPLFLLLPALAPQPSKGSEPIKQLFLSCDDYFERLTVTSPNFGILIQTQSWRTCLEQRIKGVCDMVDAGDEIMYRLSEEKLLQELIKKAKHIAKSGLPSSMEENFIRKALEVPMPSIKRDETIRLAEEENLAESGSLTPAAATPDTQSSSESAATSFSSASTAATSTSGFPTDQDKPQNIEVPSIKAPDEIKDLLRLRTSLFFIFSSYLSPQMCKTLKEMLSSSTPAVDMGPLDNHLAHLATLRQQALAARSLSDFSRKRSMNEDDEALEIRAEKKRKIDEEEKKKKAGESRAVKNLKKVNTSGMKKMSDFFKKK